MTIKHGKSRWKIYFRTCSNNREIRGQLKHEKISLAEKVNPKLFQAGYTDAAGHGGQALDQLPTQHWLPQRQGPETVRASRLVRAQSHQHPIPIRQRPHSAPKGDLPLRHRSQTGDTSPFLCDEGIFGLQRRAAER